MEGALIVVKVMAKGAKKPRKCQGCSFQKWCRGDTCFIVSTKIPGELNWLCPNCAIKRGLPEVHRRKNKFAALPPDAGEGCIMAAGEGCRILPAMLNVKPMSMTWRDLTSGYFFAGQGTAPATDISIKRS